MRLRIACMILLVTTALAGAREGKLLLVNGYALKGNIDIHPAGYISIRVGNGSAYFEYEEIDRITYAGDHTVLHIDDLSPQRVSDAFTAQAPRSRKSKYDHLIRQASRKHRVDFNLIKAVMEVESGFNPRGTSHKGAQGLMQLMPETARFLGIIDAYDPWQNIMGGSRYLGMMLETFDGDMRLALAAYNAGPKAVRKYGAIPPYRETQGYVRKVLDCYRKEQDRPGFYEYVDAGGCLYLSNYEKGQKYRRITKKK